MSDFQSLGGEETLRPIIRSFIDRVYNDTIIGFFFMSIDKEQLIQREFEFAAQHLGAPITYTGTPIAQAHQKHPINNGHFHRRMWILEQTLREHHVDEAIIERWLAHNKAFLKAVTNGMDCQD